MGLSGHKSPKMLQVILEAVAREGIWCGHLPR